MTDFGLNIGKFWKQFCRFQFKKLRRISNRNFYSFGGGKIISEELQQQIINGGFLECKDFHEGTCLQEALLRFVTVIKNSYKYYIPIHLIPLLIFKRKKLIKEPIATIKHTLYNYIKSLCFMGSYVAVLKYFLCKTKNWRRRIDGWNPAISAFIAGFSVTLEPENRRSEIALFIMPRFFETLWNWLKRRRLVAPIPGGELLVFAFAMGIINYFYQMEENAIKPTYLSLFKRFWGVN
ncbi:hypothetical protein ABPG74_016835 [Tetrahymena malaccensis]